MILGLEGALTSNLYFSMNRLLNEEDACYHLLNHLYRGEQCSKEIDGAHKSKNEQNAIKKLIGTLITQVLVSVLNDDIKCIIYIKLYSNIIQQNKQA